MGQFVTIDRHGRNRIAGAWAIGNAADPHAQLITAAGDCSRAANDINADLVASDVVRAGRQQT